MRIRTYGCHDCSSVHVKYTKLIECMFASERPLWVTGDGEYATLAYCERLTIMLHETISEARQALADINQTGCGSECVRDHQLIRLVEPSQAPRCWHLDHRS